MSFPAAAVWVSRARIRGQWLFGNADAGILAARDDGDGPR